MDLKKIVKRLEEYAGLHTAVKGWDNVGLLVEPSGPFIVKRVLITNDLTEPVLAEAVERGVNLIVAYHPVIFKPFLNRLTQVTWKQRSIVQCIENRIAVYSPHTSWDSIVPGINDWIIAEFDTINVKSVSNVTSDTHPCGFAKTLRMQLPASQVDLKDKLLIQVARSSQSVKFISQIEVKGPNESDLVELEFLASEKAIPYLIEMMRDLGDNLNTRDSLRIYDNEKPLLNNVGLGRVGWLREPLSIGECVAKMKRLFRMDTFRLALGVGKRLEDTVSVVAVGAGCCSELLNDTCAELIITGEFTHDEIVHEVHRGVSVIVTDHTNTERGHIDVFIGRFGALLAKHADESVELLRSERDRDPLEYI